ncbi:TetR/AcrR family transcriptional regulator [Puniceicoccaceae bacterium K14]|nr:TetR/AcrR family transcriptional regulator [Puniceicoccaceae bacterium K14]
MLETTDTKTQLLDCADDLIQRVGVNAMSYNDLSVAVGIRKASIHYHFPKKDDLVQALLARCSDAASQKYKSVARSDASVREKLDTLVGLYNSTLQNDKACSISMLSVEYQTQSETVKQSLDAAIKNTTSIYEEIFAQGKKEGLFAKAFDTHNAAFALYGFLIGTQILTRPLAERTIFLKAAKSYIDSLFR